MATAASTPELDKAEHWRLEVKRAEQLVEEKDSTIARLQLLQERAHGELTDGVARLSDALVVNHVAGEHVREEVSKSVGEVRERHLALMQQERRERHNVETQLERAVDKRLAEVQGHLAKDLKLAADSDRYTAQVRDEICHLYSDIEQARQYRLEAGQRLADGVRLKLGEVQEAVTAEQRIRVESQTTILELFGQMGRRMEQELEDARRERHDSMDRIIALMESVLPRLDEARRRGVEACREVLQERGQARDMASAATANLKRKSEVDLKRGSTSYRGSIAAI